MAHCLEKSHASYVHPTRLPPVILWGGGGSHISLSANCRLYLCVEKKLCSPPAFEVATYLHVLFIIHFTSLKSRVPILNMDLIIKNHIKDVFGEPCVLSPIMPSECHNSPMKMWTTNGILEFAVLFQRGAFC